MCDPGVTGAVTVVEADPLVTALAVVVPSAILAAVPSNGLVIAMPAYS
jgi:hypothetical protein